MRLRDKYTTELAVTVTLVNDRQHGGRPQAAFLIATSEVPRPGPYIIHTRTTVLQAIALAGGLGLA